MNRRKNRIKRFVLFIPLFIAGMALFSLILMLLWNAILPDVLMVKPITFLQAIGIFAISKMLFGFGGGWGGKRRHYMQERFANMTPEEREKFKAEWKDRCNRWRKKDDNPTSSAE